MLPALFIPDTANSGTCLYPLPGEHLGLPSKPTRGTFRISAINRPFNFPASNPHSSSHRLREKGNSL